MSIVGLTACTKQKHPDRASEDTLGNTHPQFLQTVLEGLKGGVFILSESGEVVHANYQARHFCQLLSSQPSDTLAIPETN
jgi:nitrogen fixation/metabolism regulation signal transduction histidine kinase